MNDIVWDIDGVLSDFTLGFKKFVNRFHNIPVAPCGAKKSWQFRGMAQAEEDVIWRRIGSGEYDWAAQGSLLTAGDWHGIRDLRAGLGDGQFLYITSRLGPERQVYAQTHQWLRDQGFPDPENIWVTNDKVQGLKEHDVQPVAFIDDDIRNIVAYHKAYPGQYVAVRDWQYNRWQEVATVYGVPSAETDAAANALRVSSISEFCYTALERIDHIDRG